MDPALKQRLIGATVLVVLAVIFVPMLVEDAPRSDAEAIDLTIPPQPGQAFETQVVPLGAPTPAVPADDPNRIVTVDTNAPTRVDAVSGEAVGGAPGPAAPAVPAAPAPAPPTVDGSLAELVPPPVAAPAADASVAPPPATSPAPTAPISNLPAPAAGGRWLVQFGSYARAENAQALAAEFNRAGIRAETERVEVDGKPALRVRSGPYADRTGAERVRAAARALRADVPSSVVEVDTAAASAAADPAAGRNPRTTGWAVQVGALADPADANALRDRLRAGGFTAYVETLRTDSGTLYRVRVGPEIQRANAERLRDSLKARFALDGQVVAHP
jgi:cell division septation protein DedD